METAAEAVGSDMVRLRVRGTLESIMAAEGCSEPIARIRFVQLSRQAATRLGLRKWKSKTQSEQEAGEESLRRFLDGVWEYRGGVRKLETGNTPWVLRIWEVGAEEWNREQRKPQQLDLEEQVRDEMERGVPEVGRRGEPRFSDRLMAAYANDDWSDVPHVAVALAKEGK